MTTTTDRTASVAPSFVFSEEQTAFAQTIRRMADKELLPSYHQRAMSDEFPVEAHKALARHGLLSLSVPERWGGQGADLVTVGLAIEEAARGDVNMAFFIAGTATIGKLVLDNLPEGEAALLAQEFMAGESLMAFALTEPRGGSDNVGMSVRARPVDGGFHLSGEKTSITLAGAADRAIVFATVDPSLGVRGISAFLVDLDETVSRQVFADPGFRPLGRGSLTFDDTFVPESRQLLEPGRGLQLALNEFEFTRAAIGLLCVGAARRAMELTIDYVREREAFGQPISKNQGVSFVLAEHETMLEAGRLLAYRALALRDAGMSCRREAAMVKWWVPQLAMRAINDCVVLHGQVGWSEEMPLQQLLRDVSGFQIGDGTPQIQKLIIARELLGRDFV